MRSLLILTTFFLFGLYSSAQCPFYLGNDSTNRYYISINPKHRQFDFLEHFGTRAFSPSLIDSSRFSIFYKIDTNDSLISVIHGHTNGIKTLSRSHADISRDIQYELLSITINRSYCPAIQPWTHSQDIYNFALKNNSFLYSQIKRSFDSKTGWHITNLSNKYLLFSSSGEHIANSSSSWMVSYLFKMKEV